VECHSTSADECIAIVGAPPELGKWENVMIMAPDWPRWKIEVDVPKRNEHVEYKYVKVRRDGVISTWEPGKNRLLKLSDSDAEESISTNDGLFAGENAPAKQQRTQHEPVENLVPGCESPAQDSEDSEVDSGVRSEAKARARDAASAAAANILAKKLAEKKPSKDVKSKSPRQIVPGCQGPAKPRQVVPGCQS